MNIAFYCPVKPMTHKTPSGDVAIAHCLYEALALAGFNVMVASEFSAFMKTPESMSFHDKKKASQDELDRIIRNWTDEGYRPDVVFTYHTMAKAPDWIGLGLARHFKTAYVVAEGCSSSGEGYENHRAESDEMLLEADLHISFKNKDIEYLKSIGVSNKVIKKTAPVTKAYNTRLNEADHSLQDKKCFELVVAGMMKSERKIENYKIIARVLKKIEMDNWRLSILGGGKNLYLVKEIFSSWGANQVRFLDQVKQSEVVDIFRSSSCHIWPGWKEPIGQVYLEAASVGCPSIALNKTGPALVIDDNGTGFLVESEADFASKIEYLILNPKVRFELGSACIEKVKNEHSVERLSGVLKTELDSLLKRYRLE